MNADAEDIRGSAVTVSGSADKVDSFLSGRKILHRETLGSLASVTVDETLNSRERAEAQELGLELSPVSLQQLMVRKTMAGAGTQGQGAQEFADDALEAKR
jgi:ABC-2 type transport system ATP-binding protein